MKRAYYLFIIFGLLSSVLKASELRVDLDDIALPKRGNNLGKHNRKDWEHFHQQFAGHLFFMSIDNPDLHEGKCVDTIDIYPKGSREHLALSFTTILRAPQENVRIVSVPEGADVFIDETTYEATRICIGKSLEPDDVRNLQTRTLLYRKAHLLDYSNAILENLDLRNANLSGAKFSNASIQSSHFTFANLAGASFKDTEIRQSTFIAASFERSQFKRIKLVKNDFSGADMIESQFKSITSSSDEFVRSNLSSATFSDVNLSDTSFFGATLTDAVMSSSQLWNVTFTGAKLFNFKLSDLKSSNIHQTYLEARGATLENISEY